MRYSTKFTTTNRTPLLVLRKALQDALFGESKATKVPASTRHGLRRVQREHFEETRVTAHGDL